MLHELVVENYAVVDRLRVRFHEGLNLLPGENHAQHDQQSLFDPAAQLGKLDALAKVREQRGKVRDLFVEWRRVSSEIAQLEGSEQEKNRLLDLWQFQHREIESVSLKPGEEVGQDGAGSGERHPGGGG